VRLQEQRARSVEHLVNQCASQLRPQGEAPSIDAVDDAFAAFIDQGLETMHLGTYSTRRSAERAREVYMAATEVNGAHNCFNMMTTSKASKRARGEKRRHGEEI
jgi:hypothetical protein